ncbi:MAG: hypothetical protein WAZ19_12715 [Anaerolineae bacterium]
MRKIARVDANQREIVSTLRAVGATVESLATIGHGLPDLLVGFRAQNYLLEVKDGAKRASAQRLTSDEAVWHETWRGQVQVVTSAWEALEVIGAG